MKKNEFNTDEGPQESEHPTNNWFAFYVKPQHEKKILNRLKDSFEIFCPLKKERVKWSDRWKTVIKPYIPGYIFANVSEQDRISILNDPSVFRTVCLGGYPAVIREEEIDTVKRIVGHSGVKDMRLESISTGDRVRIKGGELVDVNGVVVAKKGNKAVLRLESLNCNITFTMRQEMLDKQH